MRSGARTRRNAGGARTPRGAAAILSLAACAAIAPGVVVTREHEIEFVTIGDPGNAGYAGPDPLGRLTGRGSVGYEYRIGRLEITTAPWMEFVNTFSVRGGSYTWFAAPGSWGADPDPTYSGPGMRWRLRDTPNAGRFIVSGITWRECAMYANWLHNGRGSELWTIEDGAYDTSTFYTRPDGTLADQTTHHPGARFWIPTWDEWLKAAHYDPDRYGPGQGGYWDYSNSSDTAPIPGEPGVGEANTGFTLPDFGQWWIPLGSYPGAQTPWGLLDAAGATKEWTEEWWTPGVSNAERIIEGSWAGGEVSELDSVQWALSRLPHFVGATNGFRIASAVPAPSVSGLIAIFLAVQSRRQVRRQEQKKGRTGTGT